MMQKIIKAGNSIAVTVPAEFCKDLGIRVGDEVRVETRPESAKVIYHFSGSGQLLLSQDIFHKKKK